MAETQHSTKTQALEGYLRHRELLQKQLVDAQAAADEVAVQAEAGRKEVDDITENVAIARASGDHGGGGSPGLQSETNQVLLSLWRSALSVLSLTLVRIRKIMPIGVIITFDHGK